MNYYNKPGKFWTNNSVVLEVGQNLLSTFTIFNFLRDTLYSWLIALHDVGIFRFCWGRKVGIYGGECDKVLKSPRLRGFKRIPALLSRSRSWGAGGGSAAWAGSEGLALGGVGWQTGGGGGEEDLDGSGVDWLYPGHLVDVFLHLRGLRLIIVV